MQTSDSEGGKVSPQVDALVFKVRTKKNQGGRAWLCTIQLRQYGMVITNRRPVVGSGIHVF
jgi:hypothetical protein